jgi:hypothetical protein
VDVPGEFEGRLGVFKVDVVPGEFIEVPEELEEVSRELVEILREEEEEEVFFFFFRWEEEEEEEARREGFLLGAGILSELELEETVNILCSSLSLLLPLLRPSLCLFDRLIRS